MVTLLDGGMGSELRLRGVEVASHTESFWSAKALLDDPEAAQQKGATPLDPEAYAKEVQRWLDSGASIVGGCCRTRPEHIRRLTQMVMP